MSIWTHVTATFRIDEIRIDEDKQPPDWDAIIGKELIFGKNYPHRSFDTMDDWFDLACMDYDREYEEYEKDPDSFLPMGSEGSLQKSIWTNPNESMMAAYVVTVFGDLRDHCNVKEIVEWFQRVCEKCWIRQACCTIRNDLEGSRVLSWVDENVYIDTGVGELL